jgi:hypothetical protein
MLSEWRKTGSISFLFAACSLERQRWLNLWIERSAYRQFSVNRFNHFLTKLALLEFVNS